MGIKPHKAFFIVIFFISGILIGHYLPIWDNILPEFEGDAPTLSEALKDVLGMTSESLKNMTAKKTDEETPSEPEAKATNTVPAQPVLDVEKVAKKEGAYKFLDSVVTISKIINAREMKVQNDKKEEIFIILEGVEHPYEQFVPILQKHLLGQRLWCKAAIPHSAETKTLVVYAYVIPKSWNDTMGKPQLVDDLLLNRIINTQFIKTIDK